MNKTEYVAAQIRKDILSNQYPVGSKLPSEQQLCEQYEVSRLSVRNSLSMLAAQGYVRTFKGKGTFVQEFSEPRDSFSFPKDANRMDLFEFRRVLEVESAGLAAQRASTELIQKLKESTYQMQTAQDASGIAYNDELFHSLLAEATGNSVIIRVFDTMQEAFMVMFRQNVAVLGTDGYKSHLKIIAAIEARNPELARRYMYEHLNTTMEKTSMLNMGITKTPDLTK